MRARYPHAMRIHLTDFTSWGFNRMDKHTAASGSVARATD